MMKNYSKKQLVPKWNKFKLKATVKWIFIMQSKNTRDFSHEMNQICRCQINNLNINDKYGALNIYICYNIDEVKIHGSC